MKKRVEREPEPMSEAEEALFGMNASVFNVRNLEDTNSWDNISMNFRDKKFPTVEDFSVEILEALDAVTWRDQGFPVKMKEVLSREVEKIKARREKE